MIFLGDSIDEAIDWTQDTFNSLRPVAERTLFSMLRKGMVCEDTYGYTLVESKKNAEDEYARVIMGYHKPLAKFHNSRRSTLHKSLLHKKMAKMDSVDFDDKKDEKDHEAD